MVFWKQFLKISKKPVSQEIRELRRTQLQKKFQSFQEVLSSNNNVLEMMADMEEKLSGEFLFDRHYINQKITEIAEGVKKTVYKLNEISGNKYYVLHERFFEIISKIEKFLTKHWEIPASPNTLPLDELNKKSKEIQEQVIKAEIPKDLAQEIQDAYLKLSDRCGKKVSVSVRSS